MSLLQKDVSKRLTADEARQRPSNPRPLSLPLAAVAALPTRTPCRLGAFIPPVTGGGGAIGATAAPFVFCGVQVVFAAGAL